MIPSYKWKPFEDLPGNPKSLTDGELDALFRVWQDQRSILSEEHLQRFTSRLQREWAIETGILERVYSLDRGVTQTLIERGIQASLIPREATDKDPELVARIVLDHAEALEGMFAFVKGDRPLTVGYIQELHAALLRHHDTYTVVDQFGNVFEKPLQRGAYKTEANNPMRPDGSIHEYCPALQVASEMERMVALHHEHADRGVPPEVEAAWLHHVFTQIHPFADGNGRVARALASLVLLRFGWFPLVVTRDDRERYLDALEKADCGDLRPLVGLIARSQRVSLLKATEVVYEVRAPQTPEEAITAARDLLIARGQAFPPEFSNAKSTANALHMLAFDRLRALEQGLRETIGVSSSEFVFFTGAGSSGIEDLPVAASSLNYVPNPNDYHEWVLLSLKTGTVVTLVISFHALGSRFSGLMAVLIYLVGQDGPQLAVDAPFQINYQEEVASAESRFKPWLESALTRALDLWRRGL